MKYGNFEIYIHDCSGQHGRQTRPYTRYTNIRKGIPTCCEVHRKERTREIGAPIFLQTASIDDNHSKERLAHETSLIKELLLDDKLFLPILSWSDTYEPMAMLLKR